MEVGVGIFASVFFLPLGTNRTASLVEDEFVVDVSADGLESFVPGNGGSALGGGVSFAAETYSTYRECRGWGVG